MRVFMIITTFIICYIPLLLIFGITPYVTRKTESFGVSIPEHVYYDARVKKIRDGYRDNVVLYGSIVAIAILLMININSTVSAIVLPAGVFVEIGLMFIFYAGSHKKMKALKDKNIWMESKLQKVVIDTEFRKKKVRVSPWWFLLHLLTIAATMAIGLYLYDIMPDKVPMNYSLSGEVTRWAEKSYKLLLFPLYYPLQPVRVAAG